MRLTTEARNSILAAHGWHIVCDQTSTNYPWVIMDSANRWIQVCRNVTEIDDFLSKS